MPSSSICSARSRWRSASTPSLIRPGIRPEFMGGVMQLLMDIDDEPVIGLGGLDRPLFDHADLHVRSRPGVETRSVAGGLIQFSGL